MSSPTRAPSTTGRQPSSTGRWPVVLCWIAVALDGFDLVVLGATIPTIAAEGALGFTASSLTAASTIGLVGVGLGALGGPVTDRYGRRLSLIASIATFSVFAILVAVAPTKEAFIAFRFVAGLGLGACLPTALAFMSEHAPAGSNAKAVTRTMTGYHAGAVLTALLALWVIDDYGWEAMYVIGGVLGLLTLPVMWAKLPESETYLAAVEARRRGATVEVRRSSDVLKGRFLRVSLGLWAASFMGLLLVYGLNTWLPTIMGEAGYSIKAGTGLLLTLNVGAVIGLVVAGIVSDSRGNKKAVLMWFGLAAVFLAALSIRIESSTLVYAAVLLTGIFVFSAQVLVYAFVGHLYPPEIRATALGMSAGVGRLGAITGPFVSGALVTAGIAYPWGFYFYAAAAVLAVAALATVPAHLRDT